MIKKANRPPYVERICILLVTMITIGVTAFAADLNIGDGKEYTIPENETLIIKNLKMGTNSTLIINGTLRFEDNNTLSDFIIQGSTLDSKTFFYGPLFLWREKNIKIENNGTIECNNFTQEFLDFSYLNSGPTYTFSNNGAIICAGDFYSDWLKNTKYLSSCDSKIEAQNITFQGPEGWTFNGIYETNKFTLDITQKENAVNIGSNCGDSKFEVEKLILKNYATTINIKEQARFKSLDISGISTSASIQVDGILTLGKITKGTKKLLLTGNANSIMSLCYNPTDNKDLETSKSTGTVIYLQSNGIDNAWNIGKNPLSEGEFSNISNKIPDNLSKSFDECINGLNFPTLLPIELTTFTAQGTQDEIAIEWEVASEEDLLNYSVEYSKNGVDWHEIDVVDAMGTTSFATQYASTFANDFPNGFLYFRLKQVTLDGSESYSKTIVYDNTTTNKTFKTLKVGPINILYNDSERRYIEQ